MNKERMIYFIEYDNIPEGKSIYDLTKDEVKNLAEFVYSLESFMHDYNSENEPSSMHYYCRVI